MECGSCKCQGMIVLDIKSKDKNNILTNILFSSLFTRPLSYQTPASST